MDNRLKKVLLVCICFTFLVISCAENKYGGRIIGGVAGGAAGGVIGYQIAGERGAIIGSLLGSSLGFGLGWLADDYTAKQLKSAQQVRQAEIKKHGKLPKKPKLNSYRVAVNPGRTLRRGNAAKIISTVELCPSSNQASMDVREETIVLLPDKKTYKNVQKYKEVNDGGEYTFSRSINTQGMPGGAYTYKTNLYVDNKKLASRSTSFKLASNGDLMFVALK